MTQKAIFFLMTIYMFGIFIGGSACNAAEMEVNVATQVKSQAFNYDENSALIETPSEATYHPKCILSESNEDNQFDVSFIKSSPTHTVTFCKRSVSNDLVERCKLNIDGLLKRNMPPIHSVSRSILFHSLQINF